MGQCAFSPISCKVTYLRVVPIMGTFMKLTKPCIGPLHVTLGSHIYWNLQILIEALSALMYISTAHG